VYNDVRQEIIREDVFCNLPFMNTYGGNDGIIPIIDTEDDEEEKPKKIVKDKIKKMKSKVVKEKEFTTDEINENDFREGDWAEIVKEIVL
jgi:hypothetical protein